MFLLLTGRGDDPNLAFNLLTKVGQRVLPEYRFTFPEMAWWDDRDFNAFLDKFDELHGFNTHRKYALSQLIRISENIAGDTAECGVYKGASSFLILRSNQKSSINKTHHIFDSFEGLSAPSELDGAYWSEGNLSAGESVVIDMLKPFQVGDDYVLYKGWIPSRFLEIEHIGFSFVHVDVDLHQPTLDSLEFFYPRINSGGVFLCDDYGFTTCPGATKAIDEFLKDKPEKMISLPNGGGFFIKDIKIG
jgi:hypothetical protein